MITGLKINVFFLEPAGENFDWETLVVGLWILVANLFYMYTCNSHTNMILLLWMQENLQLKS